MATLYTVQCAIQAQVSAATQGLISTSIDTNGKPLTVEVGLYWPSAKSLQNNVRPANGPNGIGPSSLVTIYDRGLAKDSTRWLPNMVSETLVPATMTVVLSAAQITPLGSVTLTFGNPISLGDAVGIVLAAYLGGSEAAVPIGVAGDTAITMAAKAAALISADPVMAAMVTPTVAGPVLTLTSLLTTVNVVVAANVGNGAIGLMEIGRRSRHFQIVVWSRTPDDRITVGDPIEALIASLEANFGLTFPDGTLGRLTFTGDMQHDEATLSDTVRRDFMVCVDYGITVADQLYTVLAPIARNTTF
jgi:hypothetical protein